MRPLSFDPSGRAAVFAACRASLRTGSRSFFAASFLLPRDIARRATALYAFCRLADDLVDEGSGDRESIPTLARRLDGIYAGRPADHPADRALSAVLQEFQLPRAIFDGLIEGFAWDLEGRAYDTIEDVEAYAARVAGTVGLMMSLAMNRADAHVLARAADLGVAMQLTNIARDVGEDARAGRLYLPRAWLRAEGIDPDAFLRAPTYSPALGRVVARVLAKANALYARADSGIARLPASCRFGIAAARRLYAAIGDEIARNDFDSVTRRAVVPAGRKLRIIAAVAPGKASALLSSPVLAANAALVSAAARVTVSPMPSPPSWWNLPGRFVTVIEMFERLGQAERAMTTGGLGARRSAQLSL